MRTPWSSPRLALAVVTALALAPLQPAHAAAPAVFDEIVAPASPHRGLATSVTARLHESDPDVPLAGVDVALERTSGAGEPMWGVVATGVTDADGRVALPFRPAGSAVYRLRTDDLLSATFPMLTTAAPSTLTLSGPDRARAESRVALTTTWTTVDGLPVHGRVLLQRRSAGRWRTVRSATTDSRGATSFVLLPNADAVHRVAAVAVSEALGTVSASRALVVTPAYAVVLDPRDAPRPTRLPAQPRATTPGIDVRMGPVPDAVWPEMVGATWHAGCPVGRTGLTYLTMNYIGFDGYRHRGELVVASRVARRVATAFATLYSAGFPIRSMRREDVFGWSRRLHGADDYASMSADNTSGFNCRGVVGRPGVTSPHAYGTAIDLNPLENPDVARDGTWPSAHYTDRSRKHPGLIRTREARAFTAVGFRWGASYRDYQHFDTTRGRD